MTVHDTNNNIEQRREALVNEITGSGVALSPEVAAAFRVVPRHLFVPGVFPEIVYRDVEIVTRRDKFGVPVARSSRPSVMGEMLTAADLHPGHNVLEIGTGTGYNSALLAELVTPGGHVTTIELDPEIADAADSHLERAGTTGVTLVVADGAAGHSARAPYDRIISTACVWDIPAAWLSQLKDDGLLVTPLGFGTIQIGAVLRRLPGGGLESVALFPPAFLPLRGEAAGPQRQTTIPGSGLHISFVESQAVDETRIHTLLSYDHEVNQLPLEVDRQHLGQLNTYLLFRQPPGYALITYRVEEGLVAFGLTHFGWGIISPASACLVPFGDDPVVHTFGGADAYLTLAELAREWAASGQPCLADYRLNITPAAQEPFTPPEGAMTRVFSRPAHTFTLWRAIPKPPSPAE